MPPLEIQVFVPLIVHATFFFPCSSKIMAATSEPASGSESAKAAIASPAATRGSQAFFCASVPASTIGPLPRPCMTKAKSARPWW